MYCRRCVPSAVARSLIVDAATPEDSSGRPASSSAGCASSADAQRVDLGHQTTPLLGLEPERQRHAGDQLGIVDHRHRGCRICGVLDQTGGRHEQRVEQLVHRDPVVGRDLLPIGVDDIGLRQLVEHRCHCVLVGLRDHQVTPLVPLVDDVGHRQCIRQLGLQRHRPRTHLVDQTDLGGIERRTGRGEHLVDQLVDRGLVLFTYGQHRALPCMSHPGGREQAGQHRAGLPRPRGAVVGQLTVAQVGLDRSVRVLRGRTGGLGPLDVDVGVGLQVEVQVQVHLEVQLGQLVTIGHRCMIARVAVPRPPVAIVVP